MRILLILFSALVISACSTTSKEPMYDRLKRIEVGMTEADIRKLLGVPKREKRKGNKILFVYYPNLNKPDWPYYIRFIDREVESWGPARKKKAKK